MKIIQPSVELIDTSRVSPYEHIERVGRICYKSEDRITDDSASKFIATLYNAKHFAMLEHYHVMFKLDPDGLAAFRAMEKELDAHHHVSTQYIHISEVIHAEVCVAAYVSGSFRAFIELLEDNPTEFADALRDKLHLWFPTLFGPGSGQSNSVSIKLITREDFISQVDSYLNAESESGKQMLSAHLPWTVIFTCDRGVSHELVRHRPCAFAQESTRYCNYSHAKFGKDISFIRPCFFEESSVEYEIWKNNCKSSEADYFALLEEGRTPQEARDVLNTSLATTIAVTAVESELQHIINLRYHGTTGTPHPQMFEVMSMLYPKLVEATKGRIK